MSDQEDRTWAELAALAQAGDKKAYARLLNELTLYVPRVLASQLANADWLDDVTQDVLISVHKSLNTYSPDRPFKPWLKAIIHYRKTDFLRQHYSSRSDKSVPVDDQINLAANVTDPGDALELKDIDGELSKLPSGQKRIFEMIKIQGYSAQEVADEMGMTVSAVKVSAHRTMTKLKEKLG